MSSTMLNLFLTSGSIAEVCFSYLEVSCYKWLTMEGMMFFYFYFVPQEERFCLILQLSRFGFQSEFSHIHILEIDL